MFLDMNPGGNMENPFFEFVVARGVIPIAQITDAKFILSSSSHLDLLMTVGRMGGIGGGKCCHPRAPGINELQIEVELRG